jgi:hypothetical protein
MAGSSSISKFASHPSSTLPVGLHDYEGPITLGFSHSQMKARSLLEWNSMVSVLTLRLHRAFSAMVHDCIDRTCLDLWLQFFSAELVSPPCPLLA